MNSDTKAIIGTIAGTGLAVIAVVVTLVGGVRTDLRDIRGTMERFDRRLNAVEITLGKVVQRLTMVEQRLSVVEQRLSVVEQRLTVVEQGLSVVEQGLSAVVQRLSTVERLILPSPPR